MKAPMLMMVLFASSVSANNPKIVAKSGHIYFYSSTPMENIEAHNRQAVSILNTETGDIQISILIKSFEFKIALMQEHFNENYMESGKFPKSSFKGKITNLAGIDFKKDGTYQTEITGELSIHGVSKNVSVPNL